MSKNEKAQHDNLVDVEVALTRSEQFIEDNQKIITYTAGGILLVVALFLSIQKFYLKPQNVEAISAMFVAEQYFQKDSFNLALNGDGNYLGFNDIISDYKFTKAANLAHYYAGISYLHLGEYDEAISQLKKFSSKDRIVGPVALGAIGDAYVELGDVSKGASYYEKAASKSKNDFTSPVYLTKAAQAYEEIGKYQKALDLYNQVKENFPKSQEARQVDKYIARATIEAEK
jgi:tetratricopeptide (TPR) repeat protein